MYQAPKPFFHMFESDDFVVGLSFADEGEAKEFSGKILYCKNTPVKVGSSTHATGPASFAPKATPKPAATAGVAAAAPSRASAPVPVKPASDIASAPAEKRKNKKSGFFGIFSKKSAEPEFSLSKPTAFRHESGMSADGAARGGDTAATIPPEWRVLFQQAGVKKSELHDPETAAYLMKVIQDALVSGTVPGAPTFLAAAGAPPTPASPRAPASPRDMLSSDGSISPRSAAPAARPPPAPPANRRPSASTMRPALVRADSERPNMGTMRPLSPRAEYDRPNSSTLRPLSPRAIAAAQAEEEESDESSSSEEEDEPPTSPRPTGAPPPVPGQPPGAGLEASSGASKPPRKKKKKPVELGPDGQPIKRPKKKKKPAEIGPDGQPVKKPKKKKKKPATTDDLGASAGPVSPRKKPALKRSLTTKEAAPAIASKPPGPPPTAPKPGGAPPAPPPPPPPGPLSTPTPRREVVAPAPASTPRAASLPVADDARSGLLDQIRRGASLKSVDLTEPPDLTSLDSNQTRTLADMLASAMAARRSDLQEGHEHEEAEADDAEWSD
jgi:neural Wiskott-Aldrich syndrome protein